MTSKIRVEAPMPAKSHDVHLGGKAAASENNQPWAAPTITPSKATRAKLYVYWIYVGDGNTNHARRVQKRRSLDESNSNNDSCKRNKAETSSKIV
jgi:hypothetical protein